MSETWFIADTHFGHKNILEYEKEHRPFATVEEMNEQLINNWNNVVGAKDRVYHLGDFCFGKDNIGLAARLKGSKRLILGNHDTYPASEYFHHFDKLHGTIFWEHCILSHVPVHPDSLGSRCFMNVHGHLHSKNIMMWVPYETGSMSKIGRMEIKDENYFNVSCEQNNLTPINADIIRARVKEFL
jgi:calcineurin-like phosphoesterase family protein